MNENNCLNCRYYKKTPKGKCKHNGADHPFFEQHFCMKTHFFLYVNKGGELSPMTDCDFFEPRKVRV